MNSKTMIRLGFTMVVVTLLATACAAPTPMPDVASSGNVGQQAAAATEAPAEPRGSTDSNGFAAAAPTAAMAESAGSGPAAGAAKDAPPGAPPVSSGDTAASGGAAGSTGSGPVDVPPDQQFQQALTAGLVDDNKDFSAYLQYRTDYMRFDGAPAHDLDISERHAIRVRTANGLPVLGAVVTIYDGQSLIATITTTASGVAYFFPRAVAPQSRAQSFDVTVEKGQDSKSFTLARKNTDDIWDVSLPVQPTQGRVKLDVMFLLDSTGSMGDEIKPIKDNILNISAQITALPGHPDVHFGLVTYRDRGDQYITRTSDFTPDVQEFQSVLETVQARGGGDDPESLNEAMHQAISGQLHWRTEADTVRLVFLVADAPPHLDYPQDFDYAQEVINAAAQGIKVVPIAASNTNNQAEYIFRQIGQFTGGRFIFLTYQDTPQSNGDPGTTHHVQEGSYTSQDLDALVVKLVQEELAQLTAAQGQQ